MVQHDKEGKWIPTKCFPCGCGSEGIMVSVDQDEYYINLAFWSFNPKLEKEKGLTYWERAKYAFHILRGHSPWTAMVGMDSSVAKNFANHILYLLGKSKKKEESKPLVNWPEK